LPVNWTNLQNETFENLPKLGKSSYRRKPVSSLFKTFWTPAFAGVTVKRRFSGLKTFMVIVVNFQAIQDYALCTSIFSDQGQAVGDGHSAARGAQEAIVDFRQTFFYEAPDHFFFFRR
jgi:hypothetical protein